MRKFLLNLLFAALLIPWVTQAEAQCDNNAAMCEITVEMQDSYGDGWTGNTLNVYQGTTLRGSATISDYTNYGILTIPICPDSIRLEWVAGTYASECSFVVYDGNGAVLYSAQGGSLSQGVLATIYATCPTCFMPTAPAISSITDDGATYSWTSSSTAQSYIVQYGPANFTLGAGTSMEVTDTFAVLTGLSSNTDYDVYVRAFCAVGDSSGWKKISFRTACGPYNGALPYVEDFQSYDLSDTWFDSEITIDPCWKAYSNYQSSWEFYPYIADAGNNNKAIAMYGEDNFYSVLATPAFAEPLNTLYLSFKMANVTTEANSEMMVGVMSDPNDISTFDTISVVRCLLYSAWQHFEIPLSQYEGEGLYIAFVTPQGATSITYLDDITISTTPNCVVPTNVVANNITTTSADITWDEGSSSSWIVEYGPTGFIPGTGVGTVETTSTPAINIVDLTPSTSYDVWVLADCGDDTSYYSLCCSFRTVCGESFPIPFVEGFEGIGYGSGVKPECWITQGYNNTASNPQVSGDYQKSGLASLNIYSYRASTDTVAPWTYIMTPAIDVESYPINTLQVIFDAYTTSSGNGYPGSIIIGVVSDTANIRGTFYPIDTVTVNLAHEWQTKEIFLNNYPEAGEGRHIIIISEPIVDQVGDYAYNPIFIDNLKIEPLATCVSPASISVSSTSISSITIEWNDEFEDHNAWEVIYDTMGFAIDSIETTQAGTVVSNITDESLLISGLQAGVYYDFYVRTDCGGEYSSWRGPVTAAAGTYSMAISGIDSITTCGMTIYDDGGVLDNYSDSDNSTLIVYPSSPDSVISITGSMNTENNWDYLKIYDGAGTNGTQLCNLSGSHSLVGPFMSSTGPITIVFTSDGSNNRSGFELNVQCVEQSNCSFINSVNVDNIQAQSAFVTWTWDNNDSYDTPSEFIVTLEEVNEGVGTPIRTITTSNPYQMLSDLEPATGYTVKVRSICGPDMSPMFDSATFVTRCLLGGYVEIGDGIISNSLPTNSCFNYSYSQQIYLASEIGEATTINGVSFNLRSAAPENTRNIIVRIAHTDSAHFGSEAAYVPDSAMTVVYSGNYTFAEGWNDIMFTTPFAFNGTANVVVAVDDNTGSYSCTQNFYVHETQVAMTLRGYQDGGDILPEDLGTNTQRNNIKFLTPCNTTTPVSCIAPNMVLIDVASTSFSAIWAQGYNETAWKVEYKLSADSVWTVATASTTDTFYVFSNMNSNTEYDVRVSSICGTETLSTEASTRTLCGSYNVPFSEGFETWENSSSIDSEIDPCWNRHYTGDDAWTAYPYVSTPGHNSNNSIYMYGDSYDNSQSILTLPTITPAIDSLQVSFYAYKTSLNYQITVGVITDPTDVSTFVGIDTVTPSATSVWELFEIPMSSYTGTGGRIAFVTPEGSYNSIRIDDIHVDYIPTCPHIVNLYDTVTTATSSVLEWEDPSTATSWEIEYGPVGFTPGTGVGTSVIATSHPYTLQNLTPATRYDIYVRGICGVGDSAEWWNTTIQTSACDNPNIYVITDTLVTETAYFPTNTFYNYSYTQQIFSPEEVVPAGGEFEISAIAFQYFYEDEITRENVRIALGHVTDSVFTSEESWIADSTLQEVFFGDITFVNSNADNWVEVTFNTPFIWNGTDNLVMAVLDGTGEYFGSGKKFYSHNTAGGTNRGLYVYRDANPYDLTDLPEGELSSTLNNVKFISCGSVCPKPANLTVEAGSTTAELTWGAVGNYEVAYKEASAATWGDNIEVLNANTYTVSGLMPETNYEFRVRQICDEETTSSWALVSTTTLELPCIAPMGFTASNVALTSATIAWIDSLSNQEAWKVAYGYGADASAWDTIDVTSASIDLTNLYSNTEYTVYVRAYCSVEADVYSDWSAAFTFRTATCATVNNVASSGVTTNSATINWTKGANETKWEIAYGMEGFNESTVTPIVVEGTPSYTITGLESDFTYDVYVRAVCAEGVTSAWSNKIQFRTTVGINTASTDNVKVQIYPNPANSEATVSVDGINGKVEFVVADMNGRMIVTETINCDGSLVKTIDVSNLAKGAYFVHIYNDNFNTTRKLIVK